MAAKAINGSAALVFGGTAGIGFASAEALLRQGLPRLVIVGRNADKGEAARDRLASTFPQADIGFLACDATLPDQVEATVDAKCKIVLGYANDYDVSAPMLVEGTVTEGTLKHNGPVTVTYKVELLPPQ